MLQLHEPFDVKRTLFVDDTPRVLRSAQKFGIEHLVCVTAPDSQKPIQDAGEFFGVSHFDELCQQYAQVAAAINVIEHGIKQSPNR